MEANVEISLPKSDFKLLNDIDPEEFFIISSAKIENSEEKKDAIKVTVNKANGTKCVRCWKIIKIVKENKCSRCYKIK